MIASAEDRRLYHRVDPEYKHNVHALHNGDSLRFCYQCGACTSNCPLAQLIGVYRPNKMLEHAKLGIRGTPQSNAFLLCSACTQCTKGCPQDVRVHELMHALKKLAINSEGAEELFLIGFEDALKALSAEIPFPVSYGWICLDPGDGSAAGLKKSVRDILYRNLPHAAAESTSAVKKDALKVAVVGSGPSGLTAAWELCRAGFAVTVFEPLPEAGGMLTVGIPTYRLPNDIVAAEVEGIRALGVEIKTNSPVDKALFNQMLEGGEYSAVFIATGAHLARRIGIEGENLAGVIPALDFLRGFNLGEISRTGKKVVVIGGGNVGIDAARTAPRCGAESVGLFCLEARDEMPSHEWEIEEACAEGISINPSWGPKTILGDDGAVTGVEFIRCKSVYDKNGRFAPVYDENTKHAVDADVVIPAIGQAPAVDFLRQMVDIARGAVTVDPLTMETSLPGVFAGGDTVSGTASLIEAILAGRTAAASIAGYLDRKKG